jgi:hypothetical protein
MSLCLLFFRNSLIGVPHHRPRVESDHLQSRSPRRRECVNHTIYFCELLRVTVRVNLGAKRGYVRP